MNKYSRNWKQKAVGDRRDQRSALRDAGFEDEQDAVLWARQVLHGSGIQPQESTRAVAALRRARPELTLRTAMFILRRVTMRSTS